MGTLCASFAFVLGVRIVGLAVGGGAEYSPVVLNVIRGVLGASLIVAMVARQLTFSPPRAYSRWLTQRPRAAAISAP